MSSTVPGVHNPGSQWEEATRNTGFSYPPSCLVPGWVWKEWGRTDSTLVSGGTGLGLLHLQQSLNKFWVSGAEGRGGLGGERRGSVSAAGGQNPNPAGPGQWAPLSLGD